MNSCNIQIKPRRARKEKRLTKYKTKTPCIFVFSQYTTSSTTHMEHRSHLMGKNSLSIGKAIYFFYAMLDTTKEEIIKLQSGKLCFLAYLSLQMRVRGTKERRQRNYGTTGKNSCEIREEITTLDEAGRREKWGV